ncbi:chitin synthase-domain-containing protein [Fusarium flagelliforme]|uniref:chitin synthase-domain-containing protein n=1 Tax=Fusarium flagelliforme TaxID=2675880 RepID=UPI001E8E6338|nr:chitin synthase-domain-containing protein [Fusarium flagelliforme]KAH7174241.1 chitin synthase-domain-containing protein [Fusarium flagelliforme]
MATLSTRPMSALETFDEKKAYFDNDFTQLKKHINPPTVPERPHFDRSNTWQNASFSSTADTVVGDDEHHGPRKGSFFTLNVIPNPKIPKIIEEPTSQDLVAPNFSRPFGPKVTPERPPLYTATVEDDEDIDPLEKDPKKAGPIVTVEEKPVPLQPAPTHANDTVETCGYPKIEDPVDPARVLSPRDLRNQRVTFMGIIVLINICMAITAFFGKKSKLVFIVVLFVKSKDFLSAILSPSGMMYRSVYEWFYPPAPVSRRWILSLIPAYSESEEQIVKTIFSLRDNGVDPHRQVMVVILDGKPRDVRSHMTRMVREFQRPYVSLKWKKGVLNILAGFMEDVPVIVIEKVKNSGKKDSLVLCHDLFNYPRENSPLYTKLLRKEMWDEILPELTKGEEFSGFDMVFCTDADSTIYKGAVALLANALARDKDAIAACGLVLVELEPGYEWSFWNLYQQFQYTFGQYVRRRAEGFVGKVTCLPGCITMIACRPEMAGAIRKYSEPVTGELVINHQVQYLGTDRRLTYSMLSQGQYLRTLFVPNAVSETVAPQSLFHYLSQRRRWGSNAYFNNYFYLAGEKMIPITRIAASIEVIRLSLVYYRILNTALFIASCVRHVTALKLVPMLVVGQLPSLWFFCSILLEPELRKRGHKLAIGYLINKCVSPFMSVIIFTKVATNLGSQVWGVSGVTASSAPVAAAPTEEEEVEKKYISDSLDAAERGEVSPAMKQDSDGLTKPERARLRDERADVDI